MNRGENLDSIPIDLLLDIFSRLSAKSIGRCCCVSKLWRSMLGGPYFNELFLTRSSDHPRLLFGFKRQGEWLFFSSPQPQNLYEKSSLVVATDFHMKVSKDRSLCLCSYASGLIPNKYISGVPMICNPITGQYAVLPKLLTYREMRSFLGFDPIDKQYKVLLINEIVDRDTTIYHILTLGTGKLRWRKIHCPLTLEPYWSGICINGVLYYIAGPADGTSEVIVCFDFRSEKFKFIKAKCFDGSYTELINYKGKLGGISWKYGKVDGRRTVELCMWVLEDVEKQEWSTYIYPLPENEAFSSYPFSAAGVTATGDIVFTERITYTPFYVFYFNPERNTLQRVEIHGNHEVFDKHNLDYLVYGVVDYVEDMKKIYVVPSISPPEQKHKPTSTSTSSSKDHLVGTSTSSRKNHQVRTVAHMQQDRRTFESINKFNALCLLDDDEFTVSHPQQDRRHTFESISKFEAQRLLDDDEFTGVKACECETSHLQVSCVPLSLCSLSREFFVFSGYRVYVLYAATSISPPKQKRKP